MGIQEQACIQEVGRTVDRNGNALEQLEAILAEKGRNLAEFADLKVFDSPGLFNNLEVEVTRLRNRLDGDGTGMVALKWNCQRRETKVVLRS